MGISLLVGLATAVSLAALGLDLWLVFGVLAFWLNFVPTVGTLVAVALPMPLVLLDPAWCAPQLECVSAEDLASRASRFEILVVRPGVRDASTLPTDFNEQA